MEGDSLTTELLHTLKASIKILYSHYNSYLITFFGRIWHGYMHGIFLVKKQLFSELYMTCDLEEKEIFKKHLETLQNITQPNII